MLYVPACSKKHPNPLGWTRTVIDAPNLPLFQHFKDPQTLHFFEHILQIFESYLCTVQVTP